MGLKFFLAMLLFGVFFSAKASATQETTESVVSGPAYEETVHRRMQKWKNLLKKTPDSIVYKTKLSELLYQWAVFRGDLDLIEESIDLLDEVISVALKAEAMEVVAQLYLLNASMNLSLHRFERTELNIGKAIESGAKEVALQRIQAELYWARGHYNRAQNLVSAIARDYPSMQSLARLAILKDHLGLYQEADQIFAEAKKYDKHLDPLKSAWLDTQIGICKLKREQLKEAEKHFRDAVLKLPSYVLAMEHLAEVLGKQGNFEEAIDIYSDVVEKSDNPEFKAALADIYQQVGQLERSKILLRAAKVGFDSVLSKHPEATYQDAGVFYLAQGDLVKSKELLQKDMSLRASSETYIAMSKVQYHSKDPVSARRTITAALLMPPFSKNVCASARLVGVPVETVLHLKPACDSHYPDSPTSHRSS